MGVRASGVGSAANVGFASVRSCLEETEGRRHCRSLPPAEQSHLGTRLRIHVGLRAPRALGDTPARGSGRTFPRDVRQPSSAPAVIRSCSLAPPTATGPQGAPSRCAVRGAVASGVFQPQNSALGIMARVTLQVPDCCPDPVPHESCGVSTQFCLSPES